jgi:REP element-mobilizing transposase RayT
MPKNPHFQKLSAPAKSLSTIIRAFKTVVTTESRKINPNFAWQPRFHDHIIRDAQSFENIKKYIINNPINWKDDEYYL